MLEMHLVGGDRLLKGRCLHGGIPLQICLSGMPREVAGCWVVLTTMHCNSIVLEKTHVLLVAREAIYTAGACSAARHKETRKESKFFLQVFSSNPF